MHVEGFRTALTKVFNDYARKNKLVKDSEPNLTGEDIREGLTAIISVKIEDPQFEGQTKMKLGNSEARGAVNSIMTEQLTYFLEQNPNMQKAMNEILRSLRQQRWLLWKRLLARRKKSPCFKRSTISYGSNGEHLILS